MYNTKIENCNEELLKKQKKELINAIIYGKTKDYFKIYDIEAGCHKTRTAEIALAQMVQQTDKYALFVRQYNKDCEESANIINELVGDQVALAYYNEAIVKEKRAATQKDLHKYRVIVITHARYLQLSYNKNQRKVFTEGRKTLIIDEYVDDVKKLIVSKERLETLKAILKSDIVLHDLFLKITCKIEDCLISTPNEGRVYTRIRITNDFATNTEINRLNKLIRGNLNRLVFNNTVDFLANSEQPNIDRDFLEEITTIKALCREIDNLKEFYGQNIIMHCGVLYVPHSRYYHWTLENNIMLDASGEMQAVYETNINLYQVVPHEKVLDHSKWTLINIESNTTTSGKNRIINYYDVVNKLILEYGSKDMLVVGSKNDMDYITSVPKTQKAYFGNLIGSNEWKDLKDVMVIQTPNYGDIDYLLKYMHHTRDHLSPKLKWTTKKTGRGVKSIYSFTDKELENIRRQSIAEQIYQSLKRVNRNMSQTTNAIVICNNKEVVEIVKSQLKGCEYKCIEDVGFECEETKQDQYISKLQDISYASRFIKLLAELQDNRHPHLLHKDKCNKTVEYTYRKKTLRECLGISDSGNFHKNVLNKTNVMTYCKTRNISLKGQYVKIPQNGVPP